jgi:phosphate acetyltransferase
MAKSLYVTPTEELSGKSAVLLGVMQMILRELNRVAFFRPIINDTAVGTKDHDINLILEYFKLPLPYKETYGYTLSQARELINSGQDVAFEFNINAEIAANLGTPVLLVSSGKDTTPKEVVSSTQLNIDTLIEKGVYLLKTVYSLLLSRNSFMFFERLQPPALYKISAAPALTDQRGCHIIGHTNNNKKAKA